ncbi:MAG TPA: NAD-dependent succinate-semialdehyde dehydrogenase [Gemmatimonadaceae bacterium]
MAITSTDPATGEQLREFAPLAPSAIEDKLSCADRAARSWGAAPLDDRTRVLIRAADLLDERRAEYGKLMTREMGKTFAAAKDEAAKCATSLRYYADHAAEFLADAPVAADGEQAYVAFEPLGVVLAVMPWNFPFWQVIRFAAPALAAGNVGLLKHASNVPQCALALEQLFADAGAPPGVFQTLLIEAGQVESLIGDERIAAVTLTGSEAAGSSVASAAGRHVKKTVLELGGSDPFIVMESADIDAAARTAVTARTINNGQSCIAAKRFIVAQRIVEDFTTRFVERMRSLVVGDPMDERTNVGPLATAKIRDDLQSQVARSEKDGASLLVGGAPRAGKGFYYEPTVMRDDTRNSAAFREETFGPLAVITSVRDTSDAIAAANDSRFGLGAAAWTRDEKEIRRFARELEAGSVFVNGMVASDARFPFGGVKRSGYGRELSAFGMHEFVNVKTVRIRGAAAASVSVTE